MIDILVGGSYGDEGKGQVVAHMVESRMGDDLKESYKFSVRVGSSSAEHRFMTPHGTRHTARVLPTAGWIDPDIKLVIGAGHIIKLDSFWREVEELTELHGKDQTPRIFIDPQAGVVNPKHVEDGEEAAYKRGSTHQGCGQAAAHKVLRDGTFRVASEYPALTKFISCSCAELIDEWLHKGQLGLLEGSQGTLLSLNHGFYPYCTSKDVTPAALLAEAGISIKWVNEIWTVYRAVHMRVPGNSGPSIGQEISWEELEKALGKTIPDEIKIQTDSLERKRERIFLWSWLEFAKSIILTGPTHMALTFLDWWPEKLTMYNTNVLIAEMERIAGCPVALVRNGVHWDDHEYTNN